MEKPSTLFICGAIGFTLIAVGYLIGYISLWEQDENLSRLKNQTQIVLNNQTEMYEDLAKLDSNIKEFKTANREDIEEILSEIDIITGKIKDWKNEYTAFLDNVKKGITNLTSVNLGEVEVEKEKETE